MSIRPSDGHEQSIQHILEHNLSSPGDDVEFLVFTDASVSSDGVVGAGWVICRPDGKIVCESSRVFALPSTSDIQEAEALAVKSAIGQLKAMDWFDSGVRFYCDNESLVESFKRETKVWELTVFEEIKDFVSDTMIQWVRRDYNRVADELSKNARKAAEGAFSG